MGVQGLWELLAPVGRRVSVETLAGKKLAIDASIWMIQFLKAMRDEKGEMVRNAHLLGFFRRICKLLYLRTKPVFVFDGATPALKRRTLVARRRQRENAQAKVRKTAEKLLLNHLKAMQLRELSKELERQKPKRKGKSNAVHEKTLKDPQEKVASCSEINDTVPVSGNLEKLDEMLAASIAAEDSGIFNDEASGSAVASTSFKEDGCENDYEDTVLPEMYGEIDPDVLAALPPAMQREIVQIQKAKNDPKGKKIWSDSEPNNMVGINSERVGIVSRSTIQENLAEILPTSILDEKRGDSSHYVSPDDRANQDGEDGEDEEEEEVLIMPEMHGKFDPSVLAALPPSMQLNLLVQMRERLMAENRQKYQTVKKNPAKFSELQIQAYLKTVAFRRDIDEVQKAAAGRGVGGVQTSRIASEANREFIFSSSFTGDKQMLGLERNVDLQQQEARGKSSNSTENTESAQRSSAATRLSSPKSAIDSGDAVGIYVEQSGRLGVSTVRATDVHNIEMNMDSTPVIEKDRVNTNEIANSESIQNAIQIGDPGHSPSPNQLIEVSHEGSNEAPGFNELSTMSTLKDDGSIEIFVGDDGKDSSNGEDDLFLHLVAENPLISTFENTPSEKQSFDISSDSDWEEGIVGGEGYGFQNDSKVEARPSINRSENASDDSEVEWEEEVSDSRNMLSSQAESGKLITKGSFEEEANLQEAIRRSLADIDHPSSDNPLSEHSKLKIVSKTMLNEYCGAMEGHEQPDNVIENSVSKGSLEEESHLQEAIRRSLKDTGHQNSEFVKLKTFEEESFEDSPIRDGHGKSDSLGGKNSSPTFALSDNEAAAKGSNLYQASSSEPVSLLETTEADIISEQHLGNPREGHELSISSNKCLKEKFCISDPLVVDITNSTQLGDRKNDTEDETPCQLVELREDVFPQMESSPKGFADDIGSEEKGHREKHLDQPPLDEINHAEEPTEAEANQANLEEEFLFLGQERQNLENERRKLERNADSVNSEMFAECQELLQMFGLPYIIAPMEAEAQCAYMELANLVDGVVTDDSDVFLFGARSVYKNIFDERKYVETYFMKDIENDLGLTRDKLIRMALLLGSDYTEGISGIGIVNAIEVVNAFPEEDGLHGFREWIESPDPNILGKFSARMGESGRKKESKADENGAPNNSEASTAERNVSDLEDVKQIFMDKHRNVSKNWHIPSSFPSEAVISAYSSPQVDNSTEPFSWEKPDHFLLRRLCWEKFGWDNRKADEVLLPVLREYSKHETQLRLEAFYTFNEKFAKIRSKRIKKAVKGITGNKSTALEGDEQDILSNDRKKRKVAFDQPSGEKREKPSGRRHDDANQDEGDHTNNRTHSRSKKRVAPEKHAQPASEDVKVRKVLEETRSTEKGSPRNGRGRGTSTRGRCRKANRTTSIEFVNSSSSESENNSDGQEGNDKISQVPEEIRRSTRLRKPVSYTLHDDVEESSEQGEENFVEAMEGDAEDPPLEDAGGVPNKGEQLGSENLSEETFCKDHLETGGGFCPVQDENSRPLKEKGPPLDAEFSEDYLKMGGGFCLDERKTNVEEDGGLAFPMVAVSEIPDKDAGDEIPAESMPASMERQHNATAATDENLSKGEQSVEENARDDGVGILRAMPSLRRKRRKL